MSGQPGVTGTDFVHFNRNADGESWTVRTRHSDPALSVEVVMAFTRQPHEPIWAAERQAIHRAHALLAEWLQQFPDPAPPSAPNAIG